MSDDTWLSRVLAPTPEPEPTPMTVRQLAAMLHSVIVCRERWTAVDEALYECVMEADLRRSLPQPDTEATT